MLAERMPLPVAANDAAVPLGLVDRRGVAPALGIGLATLDRFVREGAPVRVVGGTRRRFDVPGLRAWFEARGRVGTPLYKAVEHVRAAFDRSSDATMRRCADENAGCLRIFRISKSRKRRGSRTGTTMRSGRRGVWSYA
jgi:hypothetical protein